MTGQIKISEMSGKLEGIAAINTNPLTNEFCRNRTSGICAHCYSKYALLSYRSNCTPAYQMNSDILSTTKLTLAPRISYVYVRFNAHGELINQLHFENLMFIARENPYSRFALWTKRRGLVDLSIVPKNVSLVFSNTKIIKSQKDMLPPPKGFHVRFYATTDPMLANCVGKCRDCYRCWDCPNFVALTLVR